MASMDIFLTDLRIFFVVTDVYALFDIPSEKSAHNFIKTRGGALMTVYKKQTFFSEKAKHNFIKTRGGGQRPFIRLIKKRRFYSGRRP